MKKRITIPSVFLWCSMLWAQHTNVVIDAAGSADEPSIAIDPKNPNRIVAGSNIDNVYYSNDSGRSWSKKKQSSTFGVYGDPVIVCDTAGAFYHFHLSNPSFGSWIDRIVCQKSTDGGKTWNNGSFTGLDGTKNQDKHWISIDRKTNTMYCTWTQFDKYESTAVQDSSHILFSKSTDGGTTWSAAKRINAQGGDCIDDDLTVEGAVPSVGPNGEVYVAWAGPLGLVFNRSLDGGATWLPRETKIADIGGGWNYDISGIFRCNGLPFTACDTSRSSYRGTIYVNWSDQRNGASNTDIWLVKSKDGGATWSQPKRVNDDNSNRQQFMSSMTLDPSNGWLWFVFYDRRNFATGDSTDVYMALSRDGGETFQNFKISEQPFKPIRTSFFGDYTYVSAVNNVVRPIWTAMSGTGAKTIYTSLVNVDALRVNTEGESLSKDVTKTSCYPNPVDNQLFVRFELRNSAKLTLRLYDTTGKVVATIFEKRAFQSGKNEEMIDLKNLNLPSGVYIYTIESKKGKPLATNRFVKI
ncbi:MAG: T9SS type A sorting domain-containing protein [Saprospiraceae bacterium]|nr:T9SS type A sorting domain-containing protein [Saprospiraceae bacterium]